MTVIDSIHVPESWQPTAITRSADHYYTYQGVQYPGVTGILRVIDKSDALMSWAARNTAEAALDMLMHTGEDGINSLSHLMLSTGREGTVKALTSRSSWKKDEAAKLGTQVHHLADLIVTGQPLPAMGSDVKKRAEVYAAWWAQSGWTMRTSEAMVINSAAGYGGTIDLLARDRDGRTVLADVKTGKGVYSEAVLQLTAYGMAHYIQPPGGKPLARMPEADRYVILHATLDGVREVEVNVGDLERIAWLSCIDLSKWHLTLKGKRL